MTAICFPSYDGLSNSLVMKDQMEVSPLARGVMLESASTPIRFITKRPLLFPSSSTRTLSAHLTVCFPRLMFISRERCGFTLFRMRTRVA